MIRSLSLFLCALMASISFADDSILAPGAKPELLQDQGAGEGPAWHPELGLLTSGEGNINLRSKDGTTAVYRAGAGSNGLMFDRQGRLVICEPVRRCVVERGPNGRVERLGNQLVPGFAWVQVVGADVTRDVGTPLKLRARRP